MAVRIDFAYEGEHGVRSQMPPEQAIYEQLEAATFNACDEMFDAANDLVNTPPTTLAGLIACVQISGALV